ncbi:MAG: 50S ribosomal protein L32 [Patescibacteria group bacterium]|jgi:large subunit ribosomal protein L32
MPVPKQRLASRRGRTRASHHALTKVTTVECSQCHQPTLSHRACSACGAYRGRNVRTK